MAGFRQRDALYGDIYLFDDEFEASTGWTAFNNDTTGLTTNADHVIGTKSLEFDKVDGAANTRMAGAYIIIPAADLAGFLPTDKLILALYVSATTNIASAFVRLGTDASNYNQWTWADTTITAGRWNELAISLGNCDNVTGNGWRSFDVKYLAVGVVFDAETNTLANIRVDHVGIVRSEAVGASGL